jgi:hypothetical protein
VDHTEKFRKPAAFFPVTFLSFESLSVVGTDKTVLAFNPEPKSDVSAAVLTTLDCVYSKPKLGCIVTLKTDPSAPQ